MAQQTILITGASDGIGLALARSFQTRGARVLAVGRRPAAQLDPGLRDDYCRTDLAQPYAAPLVAAFLRQRGITRLDMLIHCAGVGSYGPLEAQTPAALDLLLDTNLRAPIALSHALLPELMATRGRLVYIGSVAAALPVPEYAVYGATKAALEGFARSLRVELRGQIGVQVIHPGATRTNMHAKIGAPLERMGWHRFPAPERVAAQIVRAIKRGHSVATIGMGNRMLRLAGRHCAGLVDRAVVRGQGSGIRDQGSGIRDQKTGTSPQPSALSPQPSALSPQPSALSPQPSALSPQPSALPHCVITGGADGIGRALAEHYARAGYAVTIIDRDATRSEALAQAIRAVGGVATWIGADLAQAHGLADVLCQLNALPPANICIHSAGISAVGRFAGSVVTRQQAVLDVNLRAPLQLTAGMLRQQLLAPGGNLVFIASLSVFTSYPGAAVYAASKDGLTAYARSLRAALAGQAINVLTVFPGPTRTAHARRYSPDNRREGRRMPPERLAELIAAAVERRAHTLVPGAANRLIAALGRLAPGLSEELMRRTILAKLPQIGTLNE